MRGPLQVGCQIGLPPSMKGAQSRLSLYHSQLVKSVARLGEHIQALQKIPVVISFDAPARPVFVLLLLRLVRLVVPEKFLPWL